VVEAAKARFANMLPEPPIEGLTDNDSAYMARDTWSIGASRTGLLMDLHTAEDES
jgi:hypothetical protein